MIQFYAPDIESTLTLPQSDSQHCVRVLRMGAGDEIEVIDGRGHRFRCVIVDPHPKHAAVDILACEDMPLSWSSHITLAVAPTKHMDRMEWMVEKLTEIGVNRIVPLLCRRSARIEEVIGAYADTQRFVCYCDPSVPRLQLSREYRPFTDAVIMIGPEGDFSPEEIQKALAAGWVPVTLGDNRLRTETAAIAACHTLHVIDSITDR